MMPGTPAIGDEGTLRVVAAVLRQHGAEGWLVGGSVRDRELGRFSPDIDVVVTGDASAISRDVARLFGAPWFTLSREFGAYRVVGKNAHLDVAAVRGGDILADLAERDFTINAMALPVGGDSDEAGLIDPFGGRSDLAARRLKPVSDRIFADDPLRLMRAVRFAQVLGLDLDSRLVGMIEGSSSMLWRAAPERIAAEMLLTLGASRGGAAADGWRRVGLLGPLLPEVVESGGPDLSLLRALDDIFAGLSRHFPGAGALLERFAQPVDGAVDRAVAVRLAALFRGVAPEKAAVAARRLKLSNALVSLVQTVAGMGCLPDRLGLEAILFLWEAAPWEPEVIILGTATASDFEPARRLMSLWDERALSGPPQLPFDGNDLMEELDLEPGPLLGTALRAARLVWEAGEATTAEQALAAARAALGGA